MSARNPHIDLLGKARLSWLYPIYIPSYNRAGISPLLELLAQHHPDVRELVHVIVREEQYVDYALEYPWARFVIIPAGIEGLGPARMHGLKDAARRGYPYVIQMDDDISRVNLLERVEREGQGNHTRRHGSALSGLEKPFHLVRSLAVACRLASRTFAQQPGVSYGAIRNALMSGFLEVDEVGCMVNRRGFPAAAIFFNMRFWWHELELPPEYTRHGEDLCLMMLNLERGRQHFMMQLAAFDTKASMVTVVPLDPTDPVARRVDIDNAEHRFPTIHPYLIAQTKNKAGGVTKVGINWRKWYEATGTDRVDLSTPELVEGLEFSV